MSANDIFKEFTAFGGKDPDAETLDRIATACPLLNADLLHYPQLIGRSRKIVWNCDSVYDAVRRIFLGVHQLDPITLKYSKLDPKLAVEARALISAFNRLYPEVSGLINHLWQNPTMMPGPLNEEQMRKVVDDLFSALADLEKHINAPREDIYAKLKKPKKSVRAEPYAK